VALVIAMSLAATCEAAEGSSGRDEPARLVPLPGPPSGPALARVRHDARQPLHAGDSVRVTILGDAGARVTARLDGGGEAVPCAAAPAQPGTYTCTLTIPRGLAGRHPVVAEASGSSAGRTRLSSLLPVEVVEADPWAEVNALNIHMKPVLFAPGAHQLDDSARSVLESDLAVIESHPLLPIVVEGHCDSLEEGDPEALTRRRAEAVVAELAALGISRERLTALAMACSEPIAGTDDREGRALNRRAMILFRVPGSTAGD